METQTNGHAEEKAVSSIPTKLDLGCGDNKREGFYGVDKFKTPAVDLEADLFEFPWPLPSNHFEEVHCSHFFEHIPNLLRGKWMDELCRIMKVGAKATIIIPYAMNRRAIQDFTHEWPPVCENSFLYFNKGWREQNRLTHGWYNLTCDFDFSYNYQISNMHWSTRNMEAQQHALKHYMDIADDLVVFLVKR